MYLALYYNSSPLNISFIYRELRFDNQINTKGKISIMRRPVEGRVDLETWSTLPCVQLINSGTLTKLPNRPQVSYLQNGCDNTCHTYLRTGKSLK